MLYMWEGTFYHESTALNARLICYQMLKVWSTPQTDFFCMTLDALSSRKSAVIKIVATLLSIVTHFDRKHVHFFVNVKCSILYPWFLKRSVVFFITISPLCVFRNTISLRWKRMSRRLMKITWRILINDFILLFHNNCIS